MAIGTSEQVAGFIIDTLTLQGAISAPIAVAGNVVVYGKSFPLPRNTTFSWMIQLAGSGTKDVKVELEQGFVRPTTEGSADTTNFIVPDNKTSPIFTSISNTSLHQQSYQPNATPYGRLKFTGGAANDASVTVTVAKAYVTKNSL